MFRGVFLPRAAPLEYGDLQTLCNEIDKAEKRYDARTAKEFIGSLPNELSVDEIIKIVDEFVKENFIGQGLAVMAAIHEGKNIEDISRNNPHVHILVTTRILDSNGFDPKKLRELDQKKNVELWREQWAIVQNRVYERNGLDIRVSHQSLEVQGKEYIATPHLSIVDWQREKSGRHTLTGDKRREVYEKNKQAELEKEQSLFKQEHEISRSRSH